MLKTLLGISGRVYIPSGKERSGQDAWQADFKRDTDFNIDFDFATSSSRRRGIGNCKPCLELRATRAVKRVLQQEVEAGLRQLLSLDT